MTTYVITVLKTGKYMSANDRMGWRAKAEQTKYWRDRACFDATLAWGGWESMPRRFTGLVRITATVHIADKRRREVSNLFPTFKACIDGFVDAGVLADDSDAHVVGPDPRRAYDGPPRITFELEEVA